MDFLKKRLIGATFVLTLMVIFVPAIFDGEDLAATKSAKRTPWVNQYQTELNRQLNRSVSTTHVSVTQRVEQGNARAWCVRVGAFSDYSIAYNLERKLQDNGYKVYIQGLPSSKLYGVFVGPELVASNAEVVLHQLSEQLDLSGVIVPYDPPLYVQNS